MKPVNHIPVLCLLSLLYITACSQTTSNQTISNNKIIYTGSTPGDSMIKLLLTIPNDTNVDFIRWNLILNKSNTYLLHINFGEGQPNTIGFKSGGEKRSLAGKYEIIKHPNKEIYILSHDKFQQPISLIKVNNNLLHFLTPSHKLMVGNGGWSYTLNRQEPLTPTAALPSLSQTTPDTAPEIIFEGRTPCQDFARNFGITVPSDCFKLKWKFTLRRDPQTLLPTTYKLEWTLSRAKAIEGKWTIIKGTTSNPEAVIIQLDPGNPDKTISLLMGDENVLFFLDKNKKLFTGNADFSYTLNKRKS